MAKAGRGFKKSFYVPRNKAKYKGVGTPIARSGWERSFMEYFDNNPLILEWASEPFAIPYIKPTDGRMHRYYPDFLVIYRTADGNIRRELIEVKPSSQSRPSRSRNATTRFNESVVYAVNCAKWDAARRWCAANGAVFKILTEKGEMSGGQVVTPLVNPLHT